MTSVRFQRLVAIAGVLGASGGAPRVRPAVARDSSDALRSFRDARDGMGYLPRLHSEDEDGRFLSGLIRDGHVIVVEHGNLVIGFAVVRNGWLEHLYVSPRRQRQGHGTRLLQEAKRLSPISLKLWVFEANAGAIAFYEREGFTLQKARGAVEADNEERLPDRLYEWRAARVTSASD